MRLSTQTRTLLSALNIEFPLIQAPMAGGATTPLLVSSVSNRGCLGSLGAGYLSPQQLEKNILNIKKLTSHPFNVNLFIPTTPIIDKEKIALMQKKLNHFRQLLGIPMQETGQLPENTFPQQMEVFLSYSLPIFSFTFGLLDPYYVNALKAKKTIIMGTATNLQEAKLLQASGCDAIIAQAYEAGGHRGTFLNEEDQSLSLKPLVELLTANIQIPIIASGGIMNGLDLAENLALGAKAVQMGSAFLACNESGIPDIYKDMLVKSSGENTEFTRAFSGKPARGIVNSFMKAMRDEKEILDYPLQHYLTLDIRKASALQKCPDYMSLWAGKGIGLLKEKDQHASTIIDAIKSDTWSDYRKKR